MTGHLIFGGEEKWTAEEKLNKKVLKPRLKTNADAVCGAGSWTFQQDGAPCHREKSVQAWLAANTPSFWTRMSGLNPLDYFLWGLLEASVNTKRFESFDALKAAISSASVKLENQEVATACRIFRDRLMLCVQVGEKEIFLCPTVKFN